MRALLIASLTLASAGAWAGPPPSDAPPAAPVADGGTPGAPAKAPLNVAKMPFTQESVKQVVAYHLDDMQTCYETALSQKSKVVEGTLSTSWVITQTGKVIQPKVLSSGTSLKDAGLYKCAMDVLRNMEFPKPTDKKNHPIKYPFRLKAIR